MFGLRKMTVGAVLSLSFALAAGPQVARAAGDQDVSAGSAAVAQQQAQANSDQGKAETCLKCHDTPPATLILYTKHAQIADPRTPFAGDQCQACHGASEAHLKKPPEGQKRALPDRSFGADSATTAQEQNQVCLNCHQGGARINWHMSQHEAADQPCATCHQTHAVRDPMLVKTTQVQACIGCHAERRADLYRRSRHPIREGIIACSDCHNPHGSFGSDNLVKASVNETCFMCHADKRGPFLWEHQPVTEDCTLCHLPHSSTQDKLLKMRAPQLCQTCHLAQFHPSTLYDGTDIPPSAADIHLLARGCLNCHSRVHGSNHPSGPRLSR